MALLKFKRSATPSKVPTTSDLALGELALNTYDGKVYMKKDDGTQAIVEVGGTSGSGTVTSVDVSGGTTGLTFSGGPVTSSGTITQGGTLNVANGGTGATTAAGALTNLGAQAAATALTTSTTFGGDVSGTYNAIVVADDSHNHVISNVDGLQTALDGKVDLSGDTMSGDLIISKADARLKLYDSTGTNGNNPYVEWETTANQGIAMELNVYDSDLPVSGYGLVVREGPSNGQFPTTGTLTFNVLGEIYAGATSLGSLNKVFHDGYHPNADRLTTARTISLTGDVSGSTSFNGSANVSITATVADDSHNHIISNVDGLQNALDLRVDVSSGIASNLDTLYGAEMFGWSPSTSGTTPSAAYGQGIAIVSNGPAHNNSNNWITQLAFGTDTNTAFFRGKTNSGGWGSWNQIHHDGYAPFANLTSKTSGTGTYQTSGDFRAPIFYDSNDTGFNLNANGSAWQLQTPTGYLRAGPMNTGYCHFNTDRARYYFDKEVQFDGGINDYSGNWQLTDSLGQHNSSLRAPIFYDSNNTAYYTNPASSTRLNGWLSFGIAGGGASTSGRWISIEGNADGSGEGSGRMFFSEHNGTTAAMDNYGMSLAYRGGSTSIVGASGNTWTGLTQIGNGEWGMFGHDNNAAGAVIMSGNRNATYVKVHGASGVWAHQIRRWNGTRAIDLDNSVYTQFLNPSGSIKLWLGNNNYNYYNNDSHIFRNTASVTAMTIGSSGVVTAIGDFRAPIFYDSANTAKLVDPSSTSKVGTDNSYIQIGNDQSGKAGVIGNTATYDGTNLTYRTYWAYDSYYNGSNWAALRTSLGRKWMVDMGYHVNLFRVRYYNGTVSSPWADSAWSNLFTVDSNGSVEASGDFRAPIFYDTDNTAFYFNGASTTNINVLAGNGKTALETSDSYLRINQSSAFSSGIWFGSSNLGQSSGGYASFGSNGGTTTSRVYIYGGTYNGVNVISIDGSNGRVTALDSRAEVFYDRNNTSFYVDPASTSEFSSLTLSGAQFWKASNGAYQRVDSRVASTNYARAHWYGVTSTGGTSNFRHAWYNGSTYINVTADATGVDFSGTLRSTLLYDRDNTAYYVNAAGTTSASFAGDVNFGGELNMVSTTAENKYIDHHGDLRFRYSNNSSFFNERLRIAGASNFTECTGSFRSPVFYDKNNTGYYADFGSTGDSIRAAGDIVAFYSDDRLKDRGDNIANALDKVQSLNGFHYTANETAQKFGYKANPQVGVSAQEVEAVLPEVVKDAAIGHGYKTVDYAKLVPLLIEAIKELKAEVETLKKG